MRLFHRHKWKVEAEKPIEVETFLGSRWHEDMRIARIEKCECGHVRGWLTSSQYWRQASVPWLREMMKYKGGL